MAIKKVATVRTNKSSLIILFPNYDFKGIDQNLHDIVVISLLAGKYFI